MNAIVTQSSTALALSDTELIEVLGNSLYPGAAVPSIKLVLGYCKAAGLDPMKKPVHIVPMWDGKANRMRDVVMPGIGLYRTDADRTGNFAGQTEPEFGPMVTTKLGGVEISYPEWAKVTVKKRMSDGMVAEFTATEYWLENYAAKGGKEKSTAPNAMWSKRPRGQIAKCAAAQALRLAFPGGGAQPTADEMEGKPLYEGNGESGAPAGTVVDGATGEIIPEQTLVWPDDAFAKQLPKFRKAVAEGAAIESVFAWAETKGKLTDAQKAEIRKPAPAAAATTNAASNATAPTEQIATAEQVEAAMRAATTVDALNEAADLLNTIADPEQRKALESIYDQLAETLANTQ